MRRTGNTIYRRALFLLVALAALFGVERDASAATWTMCFVWEYQTVDSGIGEDSFSSGNNGGLAPAPGVWVDVHDWTNNSIGGSHTDQDGCIDWTAPSSSAPFDYYVDTNMLDEDLNRLTVRANGAVGRYAIKQHTPASGQSYIFQVGDETKFATTMAMASHTLKVHNTGIALKTIDVDLINNDCGANTAHCGASCNGSITQGFHKITVGRCNDANTTPPPGARRKFTIGHEVGHAILALVYGDYSSAVNGDEPLFDDTYSGSLYSATGCDDLGRYAIDSAEYSSVGYREGFAHFMSARAFNNKANTGKFQWFGNIHDLESHGSVPGSGGFIEHVCCASCSGSPPSGLSTVGDWMRWLWDAHTNTWSCCAHNLSKLEIHRLYAEARLQAEGGGYTRSTMFDAVKDSMAGTGADACLVVSGNGSCGSAKVADAGDFNGLDH